MYSCAPASTNLIRVLLPVPRNTHAVPVHMQVSVVRKVEIDLEAALEKLKGAAKDLTKGQRESVKLLAEDQKEYTKYTPGAGAGCCLLGQMCGCGGAGPWGVTWGLRESVKLLSEDQKEYTKYTQGAQMGLLRWCRGCRYTC